MSGIAFDLRASARQLRQRKLPALLAAATLGLGLGVASALFAILHALYIRPLPLDPAREVVVVRASNAEEAIEDGPLSRADMNDLLSNRMVAAFGGFRDARFALSRDGTWLPLEGALATPGLFDVFRTRPYLGRLFAAADDRPDRNHVAILSFSAWQRRFGADPAIVGRVVTLGEDAFTVIGVLPENFTAPSFRDVELWAPLSFDSDYDRGRAHRNLTVYARLAPGAALDAVRADLRLRAATLARTESETNRGWSVRALPLLEYELAAVTRPLFVLGIAVALLLAMACANMASLLFAETMRRTSELGLRAATGGSPARLFRQLFLDHLLLCLGGALAAAGVAWLLLTLGAPIAADALPRFDEIRVDRAVFLFTFGAAVVLAALLAAGSVVWAVRTEPAEHIRVSGHALTGRASRRVTAWMAGAQVLFAFVLLCLAAAYGRDYTRAVRHDPGFDRDGVTTVRVQAVAMMPRALLLQSARDASAALRVLPGMRCTALATSGPLFGGREEMKVAVDAAASDLLARYAAIDPSFFSCMRVPLASGRPFAETDDATSAPVVILSRGLAARLYPRGDAVGKTVRVGRSSAQIVGVAEDVEDARVATGGGVEVYFPFAQSPRATFFLVTRGVDSAGATNAVGRAIPSFMVLKTATLDELLERELLAPHLQMLILAVFAVTAALLTAIALYGMVILVTTSRAAEIGLRLALGATPRRVAMLLLQSVAVPVAVALPLGVIVVLTTLPEDTTLPIAAAAAVVIAVTLAVAMRTIGTMTRQEPVEALRAL